MGRDDVMTPYYDEDGITFYHGDCREVLPGLADVDLVFTSPPYNLGDMSGGLANLSGGYRTYQDQRPDYDEWQRETLTACWGALSDNGAIFYNHKPIVRDGIASLPTRLNPGLPLRQIIIWYREMGVNWSPTHFLPVHEWVMILAKPAWRLSDKSASHASDVWRIRPDMGDNEHPAPFPLKLPLTAIHATTARTVLDPFMGSGTTLRAAKDLGRSAIGIELDERYCEIAALRLAQGVLDFGSTA
jgi:site-specific DNA-methyltransferase (adenine-specific)